jgi:hypothetical protein
VGPSAVEVRRGLGAFYNLREIGEVTTGVGGASMAANGFGS